MYRVWALLIYGGAYHVSGPCWRYKLQAACGAPARYANDQLGLVMHRHADDQLDY